MRPSIRGGLRHQLGQQFDAVYTPDLAHRIDELTRHNHQLADQLQQAIDNDGALRRRTASLGDLAAARTSLRRMIRDENLTQ